MRKAVVAGILVLGAVGCSTSQSRHAAQDAQPIAPEPVVVPTVPPKTPVPEGTPVALATRPVGDSDAAAAAKKAGKDVGPIVTYAGIARADGRKIEPQGKTAQGVPIFLHPVGSGFMLVIEGKPGIANEEVARGIFRHDPNDPTQQPDLQIEVNRPLGDGNPAVCDARKPNLGGIPAIDPPSFAPSPKVSAALNDFGCRFEIFIESNASGTVNKYGDFEFFNPESKVQFVMVVARSWSFPLGDTLVSVRLRDTEGHTGPIARFIVRNQPKPTPVVKATPVPTPTAPRRRE
ncbi:MAG: hypothetical protein SF182_07425 [Deltaproteobacteria bacterium]|nr:hypothetical protein [Deltaproteobacteria bacterium]